MVPTFLLTIFRTVIIFTKLCDSTTYTYNFKINTIKKKLYIILEDLIYSYLKVKCNLNNIEPNK